MNKFKIGSMFAGIGGMDLAFQQTGFEVVWANEIDKNACTHIDTIFLILCLLRMI